jgi:DNA mismatch repair ATPase MutS
MWCSFFNKNEIKISQELNYVKPTVLTEGKTAIKAGRSSVFINSADMISLFSCEYFRHPIQELFTSPFVPNNYYSSTINSGNVKIITG